MRTVRAQGFMGIYRGMGITLLRDTPSYFAYFGKKRDQWLCSLNVFTKD